MADQKSGGASERAGGKSADGWSASTTRKSFLKGAAVTGASVTGLGLLAPAFAAASGDGADTDTDAEQHGDRSRDLEILGAAQIAEALAVTTYTGIIDAAPFFKHLTSSTQEYFTAARQEEMSHYLLEESVTKAPSPFSVFYYPEGMFSDAQTTLNVLGTLEEAFIAAYLVGVRDFSTTDLQVTAARILGVEAEHRTLARVTGPEVHKRFGGPIEKIATFGGPEEPVNPSNNYGYERTLLLPNIKAAVEALEPFAIRSAAEKAGFNVTDGYPFVPFSPTLPSALGEFHSFKG